VAFSQLNIRIMLYHHQLLHHPNFSFGNVDLI